MRKNTQKIIFWIYKLRLIITNVKELYEIICTCPKKLHRYFRSERNYQRNWSAVEYEISMMDSYNCCVYHSTVCYIPVTYGRPQLDIFDIFLKNKLGLRRNRWRLRYDSRSASPCLSLESNYLVPMYNLLGSQIAWWIIMLLSVIRSWVYAIQEAQSI